MKKLFHVKVTTLYANFNCLRPKQYPLSCILNGLNGPNIMEHCLADEKSDTSTDNSGHDLRASQTTLKSTKSLDKSSTSGSFKHEKNSIHFKNDVEYQKSQDASLKVPHKIISNWRSACDRTKDKTKDLLKRWRTLPEIEAQKLEECNKKNESTSQEKCGWSVHVWTTWVDRFSVESGEPSEETNTYQLTIVQSNKFSHFFSFLLDHDQDNLINEQDFEKLMERFRHFADWSLSSPEYNILKEIERGFTETFLTEISDDRMGFVVNEIPYLTKEGWLRKWSKLLKGSGMLSDFPVWLQFFVKVLFQVINRSGSGIVTRDELGSFYSSVLGLDKNSLQEILDIAYKAMTSNGDHPLHYQSYRLCFSNYLLGRFPNGPGQYILGAPPDTISSIMFPVDYSALNAQLEDLEQYIPDQKTNRLSIIV